MPHMQNLGAGDDRRVAIIGAGPAGLVAARWLKQAGFTPVIFEAAAALGGQWNTDATGSGTWTGMRTNTSRIMTAFSDLDHLPEVASYARQDQMQAYLVRYADHHGLLAHLRLNHPVQRLERCSAGGWTIVTAAPDPQEYGFTRVIIATGRHRAPMLPDLPGLERFSGRFGAQHAASYTGSAAFRDARVLVAGCSISALEIAADLATGGAASVIASYRRQRYILPKLVAGVPTDHVMFNRAAALASEALPFPAMMEGLKAKVLGIAGNPAQFGARHPDPDIAVAGIAQSQGFLPAVAEGRIAVRPWIDHIEDQKVIFTDGTEAEVDAILLGTGYRIALPFCAPAIADALGLAADGHGTALRLAAQTFHPDLEGLAFLGLYDLVGPYFPVLELQARWIAQCFATSGQHPSRVELAEALSGWTPEAAGMAQPMHIAAIDFARRLQAEPDLAAFPALKRALVFGPLSPASFRLCGPAALPDAPARILAAAASFGAMPDQNCTAEEAAFLNMILGAQDGPDLKIVNG
ncbi:Predicted flavoprotein CzcO associated with the cation diffusion facilitator CzcD [Gemmobacter aquatilis]|uniref:Trimethylamine monooxygenase n=1 Tax=Gemmobacter aquatilis TaxID=933059 RepID=A0A1H7Z2J5_9RHOB|nr:NAD(P)-binding domain-containing protein [Gemmobacter aquatilis]SEM52473.1 Predicted flavoprotein CzcO associated with the cation diffusion facilitator CzcD [Gemmobacter aquatilis]